MTVIKAIIATVVMAAAVKAVYFFTGSGSSFAGSIITCAGCGAVGVLVYAAMLIALRVKEFTDLLPMRKGDEK